MTGTPRPEGGPLTPAEFKGIREELGLSTRWLAARWGIQESTIQRWERNRIPAAGPATDLLDLRDQAEDLIEEGINREDGTIITPRTDADSHDGFPAMWHRHIAVRIAAETGATLDWVKVDA